MKKFLSVLCLLGLLVMPVVACAPEEPEDDTMDVEVTEEEPLETEMDEGMEEMEEEMDEMGTDMEEGMEEMDEPPPAE